MHLKSLILGIVIVVLGFGVYLNRSYASIYKFNNLDLSKVPITRNYLLENGPGEKRIRYVALGDSLTYGVGTTDYEKTYVYYFAQNELKRNLSVEVNNLGIPGAKVADVLRYQVPQAINLKPDLVTILVGINDVHNVTSVDSFQSDYSEIIRQLKANGNPTIVIINIPYLGSRELIMYPFNFYFHYKIGNFNKSIKKVSEKDNVFYIDLYKALSGRPIVDPVYYSLDGFHPNENGYKIWGEIINNR
jgi:lysophospholipase L1-like esterase